MGGTEGGTECPATPFFLQDILNMMTAAFNAQLPEESDVGLISDDI